MVLATEEPPYTLLPDGSTRFDGPSEVNEVLDRLLTEPFAQHIKGIDRRQNPQLAPVVPAKIDRVAFFGLVESVHVRAVRPRGFVRQPSAIWHEDALRVAAREGRAEIHILLRGGVTYTHLPHQSPKARRYQMDANTRALDEFSKLPVWRRCPCFQRSMRTWGWCTFLSPGHSLKSCLLNGTRAS